MKKHKIVDRPHQEITSHLVECNSDDGDPVSYQIDSTNNANKTSTDRYDY